MPGNEADAGAQDAAARLDLLMEQAAREADAHIGVTYLVVRERQVLQMTAVTGAPSRLARPWALVALAAQAPVPEAVRTGAPVWVPDPQELARRFPQSGIAFPYSVSMYIVPLVVDGVAEGALMLMWPGSRPALPAAVRARTGAIARRMADVLRAAAAGRRPVRPRDEPLIMPPPAARHREPAVALVERLTEGFIGLDLHGRMNFLNDRAAALLGRGRAGLLGTEPWDALPWLDDPAFENAFVSALFSRRPTSFTARRPDGAWLSFLLFPDATGISVRVGRQEAPVGGPGPREEVPTTAPARAGTLFHLLHLASALTRAAGVQEVAESLMEQMRPALDAEGLALMVADEGRLRVVGSRGFPPDMPAYFNGMPLTGRTEGMRTMESGVARFYPTNAELVSAFPQHRHYRDMGAFAFLPLTVSSGTFGCLVLGYDKPRPFTSDERAELTSLAGLIAQALERGRLYDANTRVARVLQDGLLPRHLPRLPGLEIAARYRPATHALDVGGDFYDLIDFGARGAAAVIGDVQGHSVQAAALMGQIRTTVHNHARTGASPEEVLASTNRLLLELNRGLFCSCLYAHIDVFGRRVVLASAGHPPPILRHPSERTEVLDLPPGLLLGIEENARFESVEVPLTPGTLLALYTDGLVERPGSDLGGSIGRLAAQLGAARDGPLDLLADTIVERAAATVVPRSSDDIAFMLVRSAHQAGRQIR